MLTVPTISSLKQRLQEFKWNELKTFYLNITGNFQTSDQHWHTKSKQEHSLSKWNSCIKIKRKDENGTLTSILLNVENISHCLRKITGLKVLHIKSRMSPFIYDDFPNE